MTTPTGAAILAATSQGFTEEMNFIPEKIGYGIGQRDTDVPNVLRVFLGDMQTNVLNRDRDTDLEVAESFLLETNIDDMNPEMYDSVVNALFDQGAQDVYLTPIIMKKSRPAVKISILCDTSAMLGIEEVLWFQTTTFGLRCSRVVKRMLPRDLSKVKTQFGEVSVKRAYYHGRRIKSKPEYEDCRKLAKERGVRLQEIYDSIAREEQD